jgi:hypothetical protein
MAPIHIIVFMLVIQVIGYILLDKYNLSKWKYLVLGIILILNVFILPDYFIPHNPNHKPICGMPAMGITLAFWIIGGGTTLVTHFVYGIFQKYLLRG